MRYFEEMESKYGFDRCPPPAEAAACRYVYCKAVNKMAEHFGSSYRLIPACGLGNGFLVLHVPATWYDQVYQPLAATQPYWYDAPDELVEQVRADFGDVFDAVDDALMRAVEHAQRCRVDDLVRVTVELCDQLDDRLAEYLENPETDA